MTYATWGEWRIQLLLDLDAMLLVVDFVGALAVANERTETSSSHLRFLIGDTLGRQLT